MKVEEILKVVTEEIANMISTKTVIGERITIEGRTIIPVTKVCFGFGSGGGEGKGKSIGEEGFGEGGAGGGSIQPVAFIVVSKEDVKVYPLKEKGILSQLAEIIPEIIEKCKCSEEDSNKEEKSG